MTTITVPGPALARLMMGTLKPGTPLNARGAAALVMKALYADEAPLVFMITVSRQLHILVNDRSQVNGYGVGIVIADMVKAYNQRDEHCLTWERYAVR